MAQAYLDELNVLVNRTSTSSAHQERVFIEHRLDAVRRDLDRAEQAMSDFSSKNTTIDIREQTRTMVDAAAKLQAELIVTQGELKSLEQIYGDGNVRVRAAEARLANLKREMVKLGGTSAELAAGSGRLAAPGFVLSRCGSDFLPAFAAASAPGRSLCKSLSQRARAGERL